MKTYKTILMLLLAATTACSKETGTGVPPRSESSIDLVLDYENREYELGDVIEATLTITEKKAAADYFCLNTSCNGGKAVATVDGVPLQWQAEQQIPYEIVNEEFSSKVLHLKITPQAGETAEQPFSFGIYVASADGDEVKDRIYANSINSAPIEVLAVYQNAPIELEEQAVDVGEVVVEITVNRAGDVTNARVVEGGDECMRSSALGSARRSRFNIDDSAPARQQGTITYIFIPQ